MHEQSDFFHPDFNSFNNKMIFKIKLQGKRTENNQIYHYYVRCDFQWEHLFMTIGILIGPQNHIPCGPGGFNLYTRFPALRGPCSSRIPPRRKRGRHLWTHNMILDGYHFVLQTGVRWYFFLDTMLRYLILTCLTYSVAAQYEYEVTSQPVPVRFLFLQGRT